jgi:hypothetical protein
MIIVSVLSCVWVYFRGPGVAVLVLSWIITLYTLWQMVEMHEMVPGKRFDRYHELGQHAFGEKLGLWIVVPQQLMVEVGVNIVYMITGGKSVTNCSTVTLPLLGQLQLTGEFNQMCTMVPRHQPQQEICSTSFQHWVM